MVQKNNNFLKLIIVLLGLFSAFFLCFTLPMLVNAAEPTVYDGSLPYKFEYIDDLNNWLLAYGCGEDIFASIEASNLPINDENYVLVYKDIGYYANEGNYRIYRAFFDLVPVTDFSTSTSNIFSDVAFMNFDNTKNSYSFFVHFDLYGGFTPIVADLQTNPNNINHQLFGHATQNTSFVDGYTYTTTTRVPVYFSKNFFYNNNTLVLEYEPIFVHPSGHATEPINDSENFINGLDGHPIPKPSQPTMSTYTPPTYTPPTIDTTNAETLLKSVFDIISYGFTYVVTVIIGVVSNLINNFVDLFNYLVDSVSWAINKIIKSIQDLATDIYNNFVSLFEPLFNNIKTLVDYIVNPWDEEEFETRLSESDFYTSITTIQTNTTRFYNAMSSIEEPDHFTLHYSTGFHPDIEVGGSAIPTIEGEISFDWLYPLRNIYRPILWVICLYEMFEYGCSSLSGALLGHNSRR